MHNTFNFSIRQEIRNSFAIFKKHWKFFVGIGLVTLLLNIAGGDRAPWVVSAVLMIASLVWSIVWIRVSLAAARSEESSFRFSALPSLLPSWKEPLMLIGIGIVALLLSVGGLIIFIIPGIYIATRLSLSSFAYLDRKEGVMKSLRYSWNITREYFWTVFLVIVVVTFLYIIGAFALGIGLLITYPVASILTAKLYYALAKQYSEKEAVAVQPVEISEQAPQPPTPENPEA